MSGNSYPAQGGIRNKATDVAIVLAVYRPDPAFLRKQVASIFTQTHDDWRLVVVPDGLDHGLPLELQRDWSCDPRVSILPPGPHGGICRTFEKGLLYVQKNLGSRWVALSDQDDIWHPRKLEVLAGALASRPSSYLTFCDSQVVDDNDRVIAASLRSCEARPDCLIPRSLLARNTVSGHAMLFRRELLDRALPFPSGMVESCLHHDHWLALAASAIGPVIFTSERLVSYRFHDKNVIGPRFARSTAKRGLKEWLQQNRRLRSTLEAKLRFYESLVSECSGRRGRMRLIEYAWLAMQDANYRTAAIYLRAACAPSPIKVA
jgi:glycosyltransferase involved in cell wall biosynthesis